MAIASLYAVSQSLPQEDRLELTSCPDIETVLSAVRILHLPDSSPGDRSYASKFLTAIQSSPHAWSLADRLLVAKFDINSTYFAAQTIRYKIQTSFRDLQQHDHEPLRQSLITHVNQISSAITTAAIDQQQQIRVIMNQLSLALAYLVILDVTWSDPLLELHSSITDPFVWLQIMTYAPEEVVECSSTSSSVPDPDARDARLRNVGSNRRRQVIRYFSSSSGRMMELINGMMMTTTSSGTNIDHRSKSLIYRSFSSWIHVLFTRDNEVTGDSVIGSHVSKTDDKIQVVRKKLLLVQAMLAHLVTSLNDLSSEDDEHDSAADALSAFMTCFFHCDPIQDLSCDLMSGVTTIVKLSQQESELLADSCMIVKFIQPLETGFTGATESEEIDKAVNIIRVFAETSDASLDLLISLIAAIDVNAGNPMTTTHTFSPLNLKSNTSPEICKSTLQRLMSQILGFMSSHYENDVAESCFNLFHRFSDTIYSLLHKNNNSSSSFGNQQQVPPHHYSDAPSKVCISSDNSSNILTSNNDARSRVQEFAMNVATSLIDGLRHHSKMEEDRESVLPIEDEFRDFRSRVRELLRDVVFMIGTEGLVQHLTVQFVNASKSQEFMSTGECWEDVEVDLFLISCLVHELLDREGNSMHDQVIARVIFEVIEATTITSAPLTAGGRVVSLKGIRILKAGSEDDMDKVSNSGKVHPQILATTCDILYELAVWLKLRSSFLGIVLSFLFNVIISSKSIPDLMIAATGALEPIIESCFAPVEESLDRRGSLSSDPNMEAEHLLGTDDAPGLILICSQLDTLSNEDAAHHLLQSAANLISSLSSKAGKSLTSQDVRLHQEKLMTQLLQPHLIRLESQIHLNTDPTIEFDRITALFRPLKLVPMTPVLNSPLPLEQEIVTKVWPMIQSVLDSFCTKSDRVIERTCRTLRYILRSVRPINLILPVTDKISTLFRETNARHSCFLYVLSILVDEFVPSSNQTGSSSNTCGISAEDGERIADWMLEKLQHVSEATFKSLNGIRIRDRPDTIDDFFRLCTRFIQKRPEKFADKFAASRDFDLFLELALHSLEIDQREANHSVTKFLTEFFESLQDKNSSQMPPNPPTTPSPFSQSSVSSASSSTSSLTAGDANSPANSSIDKARLIVVNTFGDRLTDRVMTLAMFSLPSYYIPEFADVMFALYQMDRGKAYEWFKAFFSGPAVTAKVQESVTAAGGTPEAAANLQQSIQTSFDSLVTTRHAKGMTQTLRSIHRLFRHRWKAKIWKHNPLSGSVSQI